MSKYSRGIWAAVIGAVCWGVAGTATQYLTSVQGMDSEWLTQIRLIFGGLILVVFGLIRDRKKTSEFLHSRRSMLHCIVFGICGLMFTQYAYIVAISKTNSGTATMLQYFSVVLVLIISCILAKKAPVPREYIAIVSCLAGIFLVATHGSLSSLYISRDGFLWGMIAAVAATCYIMIPQKLIKEWGAILPIGWGMIIGGVAFFFLMRVWRRPLVINREIILGLLVVVILGTVLSFTLFFMGTSVIGPARGNMIGCVEPLVATVSTALFLHTVFTPMDIVGFALILATVLLLAKQ
ncbi:MAG: DMT family transporter [Lachnospiraceae bacterium]|nr:DMT family transporter [Lachnospiraceae bacterium]